MSTKWCEYCEDTVTVGWHNTRCVGDTKPVVNVDPVKDENFKFMLELVRTQNYLGSKLGDAREEIKQLKEEIERLKKITLADKIAEVKYANKPCGRFTPY
jgi:TolA-binding protein